MSLAVDGPTCLGDVGPIALWHLQADRGCMAQVRRVHEDLRKRRLNEFMGGFNAISLKLKEMYQMITLGGDAELELVDSLDPFSEVEGPGRGLEICLMEMHWPCCQGPASAELALDWTSRNMGMTARATCCKHAFEASHLTSTILQLQLCLVQQGLRAWC